MYFGRHFARRMGFLTDYYTYFYGGWAKIGRNRYDASRFYPGGMGFRGGVFWPRKKFRWSAHGIDFAGGRPIDILERSGPVMPIVILLVISLFILLVILLVVMLLGIPICNATCNLSCNMAALPTYTFQRRAPTPCIWAAVPLLRRRKVEILELVCALRCEGYFSNSNR